MAGIRGRSGRKSWDKEQDTKKLWDKAVPIVLGYLSNQHVSEKDKVHVALEIVKRMLPAQLEHSSTGPTFEELVDASWSLKDPAVAGANGQGYSSAQ